MLDANPTVGGGRPAADGPPLGGHADPSRTGRLGAAAKGRLRRLVRGREADPRWVRPVLLAVMAMSAALVLIGLSRNGYSNTYYAAAVKSATVDWKAWFFGSLDPGSFITVDKPPLSIWLMGLSARILGFGSFSMLLPQALCTIGAVGLTYATVRRGLAERFGATTAGSAGLLAAALLALTPITVAIGRVNNPDALLVLLLAASAWATMRAVEDGRTRWLLWAGGFVGLAFMTKMLQGWMTVPALGAVYLLAGPPKLLTRVRQLLAAGAVMVVVSAAWPTAVSLWPGSKPYVGGSDDGSAWNLILGYNGFGRITGNEGGMAGGGGPTFGGTAGIWRMVNAQVGGQIAWLLPLALASLVAALWIARRGPRTDRARAVVGLLGIWLVVHLVVFSTAKGIFHPYYTSAMAPAIAGLAAVGLVLLLRAARTSWLALAALGVAVVGTAVVAVELLGRADGFQPWLRVAIPVLAAVAVLALLAARLGGPRLRRLTVVAAVAGVLAVAAGPASYSVASAGRALNGNNVLAGPESASGGGMGGPGGGGMRMGGPGAGGGPPSGTRPSGFPGGSARAQGGPPYAAGPSATSGGSRPGGSASGARGMGGMGGGISTAVVSYLEAHQGSAKYLVAASGSQTTASVIIATGRPVVTIGGFGGSDPTPTVAQLATMVRKGELRYVLVNTNGGGGGPGGGGASNALTTWVEAHGRAVQGLSTTGGTLYRVTA